MPDQLWFAAGEALKILRMKTRRVEYVLLTLLCVAAVLSADVMSAPKPDNIVSHELQGRSVIFLSARGERLRVTPYGAHIIRVQAVRAAEDFFPDDRYEMVESHDWPGSVHVSEDKTTFRLAAEGDSGIVLRISKNSMRLSFTQQGSEIPFLKDRNGIRWDGDTIRTSFAYDANEHFTALGHGFFGREESLDLRGKVARRNYGTAHGQQAPLIVPMYLSSKGYGVFLNSTFPNTFSFGKDGAYEFMIQGDGRMDFFVIGGPSFARILDAYTQLTGRPRFPPKAAFGLALSDKGNDHTSSAPSDEQWWKDKITAHRNAGFPFDHIVNDNRWRAGGGKRCESYFDWDSTRYPDPQEYERWITEHRLILTIDFNRCIASHSDGWKPSFNLPQSDSIDFGDSAPDFTRQEVRTWFWKLFWRKSINPDLGYPGDALWIDEFDEMGKTPLSMTFENGRTWQEMRNYWFFLVAKSLVQEGWDKDFEGTKRPFVWVRGMTAGAQRYATLWSGDIKPTYADMKTQIRSMQLAGLSGFPFWGHDAGGFNDWENSKGPNDAMYRQWSMAFGSFSPYWKPHGMGQSRWPLDRPAIVQKDAKRYCDLRYELMPYTYTCAHEAAATGLPMARAMVIGNEQDPHAWQSDLQFMWGNELLVAPNCADSGDVSVWLPAGGWYDFWNDSLLNGDRVFDYPAPTGKLPLFVKAGSILPMANFALSTAFIPNDSLTLRVYTGKDGRFTLYEDDGISEAYRTINESRTTDIAYDQATASLRIAPAIGRYAKAASERAYRIDFHGFAQRACIEVNGIKFPAFKTEQDAMRAGEGAVWNGSVASVFIKRLPVTTELLVKAIQGCAE
jgi:alpha-glucosidase (family GH31 glycosyl hydrolase)